VTDPRPDGPLVDYAGAASRYDAGRALPADLLRRWGDAVESLVGPVDGRRVLDLGAGTGIFSDVWRDWGAAEVVAVEPAAAMRAEAVARGTRVPFVGAQAEHLPLADGSVDLAWLSAVVHPLRDPTLVGRELGRVLWPSGWVVLRGFFPGLASLPWLDHLPGSARSTARFPTPAQVADWFAPAGFRLAGTTTVVERSVTTGRAAADWIAQMRGADSLLTAFTDDELAAGAAALRARGDTDLGPGVLALVSLRR
jgi:SAM-dependent methyltransferase